jgi:hypothetical protein
VNYRVI